MSWISGFYVVLACLSAGFIQAVTGFGFGIVAMAFLPLFLSYSASIAVSNIVSWICAINLGFRYRKHIDYRFVILPFAAYTVTSALAIQYASLQSDAFLKRLLGIFLVFISVFLYFKKGMRIKRSPKNGIIAGLLGGVGSGLFTIGGPPIVIYTLSSIDDPARYIATMQFFFILTNCFTLGMRLFKGVIPLSALPLCALGLVGLFLGNKLGSTIFQKLDMKFLINIVYIFMILMGIWIAITG